MNPQKNPKSISAHILMTILLTISGIKGETTSGTQGETTPSTEGHTNSGLQDQTTASVQEEKTLYFGALLPMSNHWWRSYGAFFEEFVQTTVDEISNRNDILRGYRLKVITVDTEGKAGLAAKRLFQLLDTPPTKLAILGAGLSQELSMVGKITQFYNLPLISYSATTSHTLSRSEFESVYITNYLGQSVNPARLSLMKAFNWNRVATLVYKDEVFETQIDNFHELLQENNYTLVTSGIITNLQNLTDVMVRFKQFGARIIMGAFRSTQAPYIFCEAYQQGLYGKYYQWVLTGASMYEGWIEYAAKNINPLPCELEHIIAASRGYLAIGNVYTRLDTDVVTVSGRTAAEYERWADTFKNATQYSQSRAHPYAYDAAWALALALNHSQSLLYPNYTLDEFDYTNSEIYDVILKSLRQTSFEGVSGTVSFNDLGQRLGPLKITQFNNDVDRLVARVDSAGGLTWLVEVKSLFEGGQPPKDQFVFLTEYLPYSEPAVITIIFLNTLGSVVAIGFLGFNIGFRNNRHIKMSSPTINNVIVLGCVIMFLYVFVITADYAQWVSNTDNAICLAEIWLQNLGFTLAFGALFAKTWRVYALFRHNKLKKKVIKDSRLLSQVGVLVLLDLAILLPWSLVHTPEREKHIIYEGDIYIEEESVRYIYYSCGHEQGVYWSMSEYIYKGLLLVFGAFLAWETRMVTIPALNDSKLIGFCIYNIAVVSVFVVLVFQVVSRDQTTLLFVVMATFASLCTTMVLCILFIPKIRLRNQVVDKRFVASLVKPGDSTQNYSNNGTERVTDARVSENRLSQTGLSDTEPAHITALPPREATLSPIRPNHLDPSSAKLASPGVNSSDLQTEITRVKNQLGEELRAVAKLKRDFVRETQGALSFHKVGPDYLIFRTPGVVMPSKLGSSSSDQGPFITETSSDFGFKRRMTSSNLSIFQADVVTLDATANSSVT